MNDQYTVPNQALQTNNAKKRPTPRHNLPKARPARAASSIPQQRLMPRRPMKSKKKKSSLWLLLIPMGMLGFLILTVVAGFIMLQVSFANKILPRVEVAGIAVGNQTQAEAITTLNGAWNRITLTDGTSTIDANPVALGIIIDVEESIAQAFAQGHGEGGWTAFFSPVTIAPVITIDANIMNTQLTELANQIERQPRNAGVAFVDGQVQATEPVYGTLLDVQATINALQVNPASLADGILDLTMRDLAPSVLDASALVAQAQSILSSPLDLRVFDPVTGDSVYWSSSPDVWSNWLTATSDTNSPIGLSLSVDSNDVRQYLSGQIAASFDSSRTIDLDDAVQSIQQAFANGAPQAATIVVQHNDRIHTVQAGENITSIAWDYGIPYLYIVNANNGVESVNIGQQLTIPAADTFIQDDFNPNKRIVVSISQQRTYVYENNTLLYEWVSSTGISSSPTWTGIYQVLSHEPNAYAANWNLYMPNFMGVYEPVPNSDFTNGFHGFPTRGGGQLLWENSLGTRVTYGCILLSDSHIVILYNWAEDGVIVEIRP
ncbi:MAG: L,D-transpeptidase family protein [Phototrophicaceae bacterium]